MSADPVLSRELKSLREELRQRRSGNVPFSPRTASQKPPFRQAPALARRIGDSAASARRPEESSAEQELRSQLRDLVKEITDFVNDAENNISAHPAMSVVAAMLLGIHNRQLTRTSLAASA